MTALQNLLNTFRNAAASEREKGTYFEELILSYPERKNPAWPSIDLQTTRDALMAAEAFRNAVVHSLWHIGGSEPQWRRTKASLRSKGRLSVSSGAVNLGAFDEGVRCLREVESWYVGRREKVTVAAARLKALVNELSERDGGSDAA